MLRATLPVTGIDNEAFCGQKDDQNKDNRAYKPKVRANNTDF